MNVSFEPHVPEGYEARCPLCGETIFFKNQSATKFAKSAWMHWKCALWVHPKAEVFFGEASGVEHDVTTETAQVLNRIRSIGNDKKTTD